MQDITTYKRAKEICNIFSISRATLYRYAKDPEFPKPLKPTSRVTLWDIKAIEEFLRNRTQKVSNAN